MVYAVESLPLFIRRRSMRKLFLSLLLAAVTAVLAAAPVLADSTGPGW